ncbi:MAG TPA: hypothetical protein DEG17_07935 [Cyanobacteria bacterium UBA11149]|nr:hypothetical protein [Cyanobacteria bacterium UBA11367]HBE60182.1 hypothetical protein [Cyanobacteria bacterium UBA11366]HBK66846.1 hypothetical protein [Cyanobacteria bacterium UBA11166]HBR75501.1 hypothetical protein [Cyanobacteria bacterium UBA11159]HBS70599.1 hypothetical protein [Cyanobacteria bacterium UBA11153]HBW88791.1 hypothetical protein [Cyanobacteria bacterium UBA11149]HCA98240.1 hypothetical protein [Cyanobacteria bacterium UBA9226]
MNNKKWLNWAIGLSVVGSSAIAFPGNAIPPNQSDITGTNIWNNTAPIFDESGEIDPEILAKARSLDRALENASASCNQSLANQPRRFARQPGSVNVSCQELKNLIQESQAFLEEVNQIQGAQAASSRNRIW